MKIRKSAIPPNSILTKYHYNYADSFEGDLTAHHQNLSITEVGKAFFSSGPRWIEKLFALRNSLVKRLGLKTPANTTNKQAQLAQFNGEVGERLGLFEVFYRDEKEMVLGEDDKHLNFRVSLLLSDSVKTSRQKCLTITTTVQFHNKWGKLYFLPVKPFHRLIVPTMLKNIIKHLEKEHVESHL